MSTSPSLVELPWHSAAPAGAGKRPLHLGTFWDHRDSLSDSDDLVSFLHDLLAGFLDTDPTLRITMLVAAENEQSLPAITTDGWGGRFDLLALTPPPLRRSEQLRRLLSTVRESLDRAAHRLAVLGNRLAAAVTPPLGDLWRWERKVWRRGPGKWPAGLLLLSGAVTSATLLGLTPLMFAARWLGVILGQLVFGCLFPLLRFPLRLAGKALGGDLPPFSLRPAVESLDCDVWLDLSPSASFPAPRPHVLVWHARGFPSKPRSERQGVARTQMLLPRAQAATLVYYPLELTRTDLMACLPDSAERVRTFPLVLPSAAARGLLPDVATLSWKYRVGKHFLYVPADLEWKSHAGLMRALRELRDEEGPTPELVCAGKGAVMPKLRQLQDELGLRYQVHFLGAIPPEDSQAFCQHAQAVVLPSFHDWTAAAVMDAIASGGTVVCADIPAYRELFQPYPETVLFFNPHDPSAVARAIRRTLARRESYRAAQGRAYRHLARRDWRDVARDFLELCQEARARAAAQPGQSSAA